MIKHLSEKVSVSVQVTPEDMPDLARAGVTLLVCNRPDGEEADQPNMKEIKAAAEKVGIDFLELAFTMQSLSPEYIDHFRAECEKAIGNVHAYCASGLRSTILWGLSRAGYDKADALIASAAEAGYDINIIRPVIDRAKR